MNDRHERAYGELARQGAVNYAGQLGAVLVGLAIIPVLLDELGAQHYGILVVALTCAAVALFLDLGLGTTVTREVAARSPDGQEFLAGAASAFIGFGAVGAVLLCLVGV